MENLSGYFSTPVSLTGKESQAATSTVSSRPAFGAPGSASESVTDDDVRDEPSPAPGVSGDDRAEVTVHGEGNAPAAAWAWRDVSGRGWR